jgi:hypothetical protein
MSTEYLKETFRADEIRDEKAKRLVEEILDDEPVVKPEEVRDKQVLIRVSESQREQWQEAADSDGTSVSEWLRSMADGRYREIFTCTHPLESRQVYPWSEFCLACGTRMR